MVDDVMNVLDRTIGLASLSPLHGRIEVFSMLLEQNGKVDVLNRHKHASLKLVVMHGKTGCMEKLIQAGANILMFDSILSKNLLELCCVLWPCRLPKGYSFSCSFHACCRFLGICQICEYKMWKWCYATASCCSP